MKGEWCYTEKYFSDDFCESVQNELKGENLHNPTIGYRGVEHSDYREGKITWLDRKKYENIYDEIWKLSGKINEDWFGFHLTGMENIQFTKYMSEGKGYYKSHQDVFWINPSPNHRKLTCVIQLSDENSYEGGNLILHNCEESPNRDSIRKRGTVIFFPSFVYHEVEQILSGERCSLVCWIYGPKWR